MTINQAIEIAFELVGWRPSRIKRNLSKSQGVASRAADITNPLNVLGFAPKVSYKDGFKKTINWYFASKDVKTVKANLRSRFLLERSRASARNRANKAN